MDLTGVSTCRSGIIAYVESAGGRNRVGITIDIEIVVVLVHEEDVRWRVLSHLSIDGDISQSLP